MDEARRAFVDSSSPSDVLTNEGKGVEEVNALEKSVRVRLELRATSVARSGKEAAAAVASDAVPLVGGAEATSLMLAVC